MSLEKQFVVLLKEIHEERALSDKRAKQLFGLISGAGGGGVPIGAIVPYLGGYFTDGSNGGFTMVMAAANTVAAVNTLLNPDGFHVCDGAVLNDGDSPIFNGAGRYLPNLTDDRFLMGDTLAGGTGGSNTMAHTHGPGSFIAPTHRHYVAAKNTATGSVCDWSSTYPGPQGGFCGDCHYHTLGAHYTNYSGNISITGTSAAASNDENRPKYLSCFYIMRIK